MEEDLENHGEASVWYFEIAENKTTPSRFRIQAMLNGFKQIASSGGAVDTTKVGETVSSVLNGVDDYKVALDAARQLALAGTSFLDLKFAASERGQKLADIALKKADSANERLTSLEYLTRRQAWDLGDYNSILDRWDRLTSADRSEFQAMSGSLWYEYLSLIFRSLKARKRDNEAELLIANVIDRDSAPPEGFVIVGIEYAAWLLKTGKKDAAFEYFEWIAKESPTHRRAAKAHYWLALRSIKQGQADDARRSAEKVRKCYAGVPALLEEWEFDSAALIVIKNNVEEALRGSGVFYTKEYLERANLRIRLDLETL